MYAGIRNTQSEGALQLRQLAEKETLDLKIIQLDVTNESQCSEAIVKVAEEAGKIDVLINNAGFGYLGPMELFSDHEVRNQYETNVFSVLRLTRLVAPIMRNLGQGTIINISSISGLITFPLNGLYSSSKFALESISEALAFELQHFGINVVLVEPGTFETKFVKNSKKAERLKDDVIYKDLVSVFSFRYSRVRPRQNAKRIADLLFEIANKSNPRLRYVIGKDARTYLSVRRLLPQKAWFFILKYFYKW